MNPTPLIKPSTIRAVASAFSPGHGLGCLDEPAGGDCDDRERAKTGAAFVAFTVPGDRNSKDICEQKDGQVPKKIDVGADTAEPFAHPILHGFALENMGKGRDSASMPFPV
jgi:hypothetical protein